MSFTVFLEWTKKRKAPQDLTVWSNTSTCSSEQTTRPMQGGRGDYKRDSKRKCPCGESVTSTAAQHGWIVEGGALQPVLMTKTPAPQGLELTASHN